MESEEESMGEPAKTLRLIGVLLLVAFISWHGYRLFFQQTMSEHGRLCTQQDGTNRRLHTRWGATQAEIVVCDNEQQALEEYLFYRSDATKYAKSEGRQLSQDIIVTTYDRYYVSFIQRQRDHMTGLPEIDIFRHWDL